MGSSGVQRGGDAGIEALLDRWQARGDAGLVVAVETPEHGVRTWTRGTLPAAAASVLEIGSVTKVMTALLLADGVRRGDWGLDEPVADLLEGHGPPERGRPITLLDLATHRSGLPRLPSGSGVRGWTSERADPYARFDDVAFEEAITRTAPRRPPGGRVAYSNHGAALLGHALGQRAGSAYADLLRDRVTGPTAMTSTVVGAAGADVGRLAQGHTRRGRPHAGWDMAAMAAAGGVLSTAHDLLALGRLHHLDAVGDLAGAASQTLVPRAPAGPGLRVGLAWQLPGHRRHPEVEMAFHGGRTGGFASIVVVLPRRRSTVVVLSSQARSVDALGMGVARTTSPGPQARPAPRSSTTGG